MEIIVLHMYYDNINYVHTYIRIIILLDVQQSIQLPISTAVTTSTQSLLSSDQLHYAMSSSE